MWLAAAFSEIHVRSGGSENEHSSRNSGAMPGLVRGKCCST